MEIKMTEDVLISVKGLHALDTADEEEVEVFSAGKYYFKNGKHYIFYDEMVEDTGKGRFTGPVGYIDIVPDKARAYWGEE